MSEHPRSSPAETSPAAPGAAEPAVRDDPEPSPSPAGPAAPITDAAPPREPGYRGLALALAIVLLVVVALVAAAPFWSPLLPWGDGRAGPDPALLARLETERQRRDRLEQQLATLAAAMPPLQQRIATLEQKPPPSPPDLGEIRQQINAAAAGVADLKTRLARLEEAVPTTGLVEFKTTLDRLGATQQAQAAALSDLTNRLNQVGQARQAQADDLAARLGSLQQGLQAQQSVAAELRTRLQNLEKTTQARGGGLTDIGLALVLLRVRDAVETGRPFAAEYEALSSLAKARPDIAAAAAPLAAAAPAGVADRAALARELHGLAQRAETAPAAPDSGAGWIDAVLDRLRGLVRIRRADEIDPSRQAEAAITVAERALAGGDLDRAVAAIETLPGGEAEAASDWLRRARERLAVEAALRRLDALLTARLGDTTIQSGAPG